MEYAIGARNEPPTRGMIARQPGVSSIVHNGKRSVDIAHTFGAIGQEVKAASHASTASTCSSDDREEGVPIDTFKDSRERAGSLRELVEHSTPIESIAFAAPSERLNYAPSRHYVSPTNSQEAFTELSLRSPAWTLQVSPQSAIHNFEPLPWQVVDPFRSATFHTPILPPAEPHMPPESDLEHLPTTGHANAYVQVNHSPLLPPMQVPQPLPALPQNSSPEHKIMNYRELIFGINLDLEKMCREYVMITIKTNTADSQTDLAFLDLVVAHMGSRDAAAYILKRTDLHVALVVGMVWRQVSKYILSKPVLDKAPSRSAAAFYHAWLDETFAHFYEADNLFLRQTLVYQRSSFVADIQRAPEYQAFVKTFGTQVAGDVVKDLMPVWRIGCSYKVGQILIDKFTTKLVRLISRMRGEAKMFHFDFPGFGTGFSGLGMSKRNPDLLFEHGNDGTYAVMCNISPALYETEISPDRLDTRAIYLAEVLVYDKFKNIDEALGSVKLYGPMSMPPPQMGGGRRRSRRKTGTAPFFDRRDSATMQTLN